MRKGILFSTAVAAVLVLIAVVLGGCVEENPGLQIELAGTSFSWGDTVSFSLKNNLSEPVFLPGCNQFEIEKAEGDFPMQWAPFTLVQCVWEGNAVEVKPGETKEFSFLAANDNFLGGGKFRISVTAGTGCSANKPLSQADCNGFVAAKSGEFTVEPKPDNPPEARFSYSVSPCQGDPYRITEEQMQKPPFYASAVKEGNEIILRKRISSFCAPRVELGAAEAGQDYVISITVPEGPVSSCNCLFDLNMVVENLPPGIEYIKVNFNGKENALLVSAIPNADDTTFMKYQPMQCEALPWGSSGEESAIKEFYMGNYGIEIISTQEICTDALTCEACGVCPTGCFFEAEIYQKDKAKMIALGWEELGRV